MKKQEPVRTNSTYHNRERHTGAFSRRIQFMCPVVSAQAGASVFNGVLTVRVPKQMH
ncbi:hypothetical protein BC830DRAFT_1136238 [Chytriomyces sp. MP71]|nr:hypothetical protein BC830DRAFT_1136238 [Chytriomyces sp. MP71]